MSSYFYKNFANFNYDPTIINIHKSHFYVPSEEYIGFAIMLLLSQNIKEEVIIFILMIECLKKKCLKISIIQILVN